MGRNCDSMVWWLPWLGFFFSCQKPTAIAKILGVYRIGYQNSKTTTALKQDLLVMENLFYGCKISQVRQCFQQFNLFGDSMFNDAFISLCGVCLTCYCCCCDVLMKHHYAVSFPSQYEQQPRPHNFPLCLIKMTLRGTTEVLKQGSVIGYLGTAIVP